MHCHLDTDDFKSGSLSFGKKYDLQVGCISIWKKEFFIGEDIFIAGVVQFCHFVKRIFISFK